MRKKLFKEIYTLLEGIVPDNLHSAKDCFLGHKSDDEQSSVFIRFVAGDIINIGAWVFDDGYPLEENQCIMYDNKRKLARIANFRPIENTNPLQVKRDMDADEDCQDEIDENDSLKAYLKNLKKLTDKDPSFFKEIDTKGKHGYYNL